MPIFFLNGTLWHGKKISEKVISDHVSKNYKGITAPEIACVNREMSQIGWDHHADLCDCEVKNYTTFDIVKDEVLFMYHLAMTLPMP